MRTVPFPRDSEICATLAPELKAAWIRILSAIQTSEIMEYQVLDPLLETLQHDPQSREFLRAQSLDEKRHGDSIRLYLLESLSFEKTSPTFSDRIFYSMIFPLARRFLFKRAVYAFAILLFYERF
jgi:hypothetical protein